MKLPLQLAILCVLSCSVIAQSDNAHAEKPAGWITESSVIDTGWVDSNPIGHCLNSHYPICVEIKPLAGDGVRYKAVFIPKPKGEFYYKCVVGIRTAEYEKLNEDFIAEGFIQISHQVVTVMIGNVHQSVWVSRIKREQASARKPATRHESKSEGRDQPQPESEERSR